MTLKITAQEMHRHDTSNHQIIKTKVPKENIDDRGSIILPHLRRSGLSAGDHLLVQCMSDNGDTLLAEADFVVFSAIATTTRIEGDNQNEMTVQQTNYRLARCSEWWSPPGVGAAQAPRPPGDAAPPTPAKATKAA